MNLGKLKFSVEDKFVILNLNEESNLLPEGVVLENIVETINSLSKYYQVLCDFRDVRLITRDLRDFIEYFDFTNAKILVNQDTEDFFRENIKSELDIFCVSSFNNSFLGKDLDLTIFADAIIEAHYADYARTYSKIERKFKGLPTDEEWEYLINILGIDNIYDKDEYISICKDSLNRLNPYGEEKILRRRYLSYFLNVLGKKSLLNEYVIQFSNKEASIYAYHSNSIHQIECKNQLLLGKPAIVADRSSFIFETELNDFQILLNKPRLREGEIQSFFENNPAFIKSLGYQEISPKVILQRDDGSYLQPDFFVQPIGESWWDILDIKLPKAKTVTMSKRDRYKFSSEVMELNAQLREYANYFDNEKYSKRIEDKYGIKCYKPKLIGIIGKETDTLDERQLKRVLSSYTDANFITFDRLVEIAKTRLLI